MNSHRFQDALQAAGVYLFAVVLLPVLMLVGFGFAWLFERQLMVPVLLIWLAIGVLGWFGLIVWPRRRLADAIAEELPEALERGGEEQEERSDLPEQLSARPDWSTRDIEAWTQLCRYTEARLEDAPDWQAMPEIALDHLAEAAAIYHGVADDKHATWQFSIPEALLVIAEASARYRRLLLEHLPFIERVKLNTLLSIYEHQGTLRRGLRWTSHARRAARLVNPVAAVIGELRDQLASRVLSHASTSLQKDLKRLLLQEVSQVAIDLYSGRLKVSEAELANFKSASLDADLARRAAALEPLRVVLIGQSGAGKSSLINALQSANFAETDVLASTDRPTLYVLNADDGNAEAASRGEAESAAIHLLDTPGLDGSDRRAQDALMEAFNADIIIWVSRATQPSRASERAFIETLTAAFSAQSERRPPVLLLALTHVDQLPPRGQWQPPYDLASDAPKAQSINQALESVLQALSLDEHTPSVALSLKPGSEHWNVDTLLDTLQSLEGEAALVQLNRRRLEAGDAHRGLRARLDQIGRLGKSGSRLLLRRHRKQPPPPSR